MTVPAVAIRDDDEHAALMPHEVVLAGCWTDGTPASADDTDRRIRWLTTHVLHSLGSANDGWNWLYRDPADGRLWELTFPQAMVLHSGPRLLRVLDPAVASEGV